MDNNNNNVVDSGSPNDDDELQQVQDLLRQATDHRAQIQALIKTLQKELAVLFTKSPSRPRDRLTDIDGKIEQLEHERTVASMSLKDEREILRQIYKLQKTRREIYAFAEYDKRVKSTKTRVASLRDGLQSLNSAISEMRVKIALVETARTLNCPVSELMGMKLDLSTNTTNTTTNNDKSIGRIIGKQGSNLDQIRQKSNVSIDVSPKNNQIRMIGTIDSLQDAKLNFDRIINTKEEVVMGNVDFVDYVTSKGITALDDLRARHPGTSFDVNRRTGQIRMRGYVDDLQSLKQDIVTSFVVDIGTKTMPVPASVTSAIIGKQGATVQGLVEKHQATITMNRDDAEHPYLHLAGPVSNIEAVMADVNNIIYESEDTTQEIVAGKSIRNVLLHDGAKAKSILLKKIREQLKTEGSDNFTLLFNKSDNLEFKGKSKDISTAVSVIEVEIDHLKTLSQTLNVDKSSIPRIIGKKGEGIKAFHKKFPGVVVEFDNDMGTINLTASTKQELDNAKAAIVLLVAKNEVERISVDTSFYESIFKELVRQDTWKEMNELVLLSTDKPNSQLVMRGKQENMDEARSLFDNYMKQNFTKRIPATVEEIVMLIKGGKESKIVDIQKEHSVSLRSDRDERCIIARGEIEKVESAEKAISDFLHGGDGTTVHHMSFDDEQLGAIIGKGGKNIVSLEKKYESVKFLLHHKKASVTLRGPKDDIAAAIDDINELVANIKVFKTLTFSKDEMKKLGRQENIRRLVQNIPVVVNMAANKDDVSLRGSSSDVDDATALLKEKAGLAYEKKVRFDPEIYEKISESLKDGEHVKRIESSTEAHVVLDREGETVMFRGTVSSVTKAKQEFINFLSFLLESKFAHISISAEAERQMSFSNELPKIQSQSKAQVTLDRDVHEVMIFSLDNEKARAAKEMLNSVILASKKKCNIITLDSDEDWILSSIIGNKGSRIKEIRKETGCTVTADSKKLTITVVGEEESKVANGMETIQNIISNLRKKRAVITLSSEDAPAFIGKKGANITAFEEKYEVRVQKVKDKEGSMNITGEEENVAKAKQAFLDWISTRQGSKEELHKEEMIKVYRRHIPAIIGEKGNVVRSLQSESGCRINIDKEANMVKIRGGSPEKRAALIDKIKGIMAEEDLGEEKMSSPGVIGEKLSSATSPVASLPNTAADQPVRVGSPDSRFFSGKKLDFPTLSTNGTRERIEDVKPSLSWTTLFSQDGNGYDENDDEPPPLIEGVLADGVWHSIAETSHCADQELQAVHQMEGEVRRKLDSMQI